MNADVHLSEYGEPEQPDEWPQVLLEDVYSDILLTEMQTGQHLTADPSIKPTATLPPDESALCTPITILNNYYKDNFSSVLCVLGGYVVAVHCESVISEYGYVPATIVYGDVQS